MQRMEAMATSQQRLLELVVAGLAGQGSGAGMHRQLFLEDRPQAFHIPPRGVAPTLALPAPPVALVAVATVVAPIADGAAEVAGPLVESVESTGGVTEDIDVMLDMLSSRKADGKSGSIAKASGGSGSAESPSVAKSKAKALAAKASGPPAKAKVAAKVAKMAAKGKVVVAKVKAKAAEPETLGCSKCRWSARGCGKCRDPEFAGFRYH